MAEGQGNISIGFNGATLHAAVTESGAQSWAGSTSFLALALWIAGPPLALWAAWMFANARGRGAESPAPAELGEGMAESTLRSPLQASAEGTENIAPR